MATLYWGPSGGTSTGTWDGSSATRWFTDAGRTTPSGAAPTSSDDVVFDKGSDNGTTFNVTLGAGAVCQNITIVNLDFTMTLTHSVALSVYGSLSFPSTGLTRAGFNAINFLATSSQTVDFNGYDLDNAIVFNGVGGAWTLLSNLGSSSTSKTNFSTTLTNGALDLNGFTLNGRLFSSNNSNARSVAFNGGKIALWGNGANIWAVQTATNFTYTGTPVVEGTYSGATGGRNFYHGTTAGATEANTPSFHITAGTDTVGFLNARTIDLTGFAGTLAGSARTMYGNLVISSGTTVGSNANATSFAATSGTQQITTAGKTFDFPLTFNGIGGTFAFQDALTQGSTRAFTITNGTVQLKNGVTSTVGAFATSGTNQKFLQSTVAGTQATLSQASGTVSASYLTIQDIGATGGATWNSLWSNNNVDAGNNTGWVFGDPPITLATEYTYALRSFTQPRRF